MLRHTALIVGVLLLAAASIAQAQERKRQDGRRAGALAGRGSALAQPVMLLATAEVQQELKINDAQKKQIDELVAERQQQMRDNLAGFQGLRDLSPEERRKRFEEAQRKSAESNRIADEKIAAVLDAKQQARLNQLRLQREGVLAFNRPEVAKQIGISDEQQAKIRQVQQDARGQGIGARGGAANLTQEERRAASTKMREQREKVEADILAVLTSEQKSKWSEMKGAEFKFPESARGLFSGNAPRAGAAVKKRPDTKKEN